MPCKTRGVIKTNFQVYIAFVPFLQKAWVNNHLLTFQNDYVEGRMLAIYNTETEDVKQFEGTKIVIKNSHENVLIIIYYKKRIIFYFAITLDALLEKHWKTGAYGPKKNPWKFDFDLISHCRVITVLLVLWAHTLCKCYWRPLWSLWRHR